jgi:hypothetical protein
VDLTWPQMYEKDIICLKKKAPAIYAGARQPLIKPN